MGHNHGGIAVFNTDDMSAAEMAVQLRWTAGTIRCAGEAMFVLLGGPGDKPKLEVSSKQRDLLRKLNDLTVAVRKEWLTAGLDAIPLPMHTELADRLGEPGERIKDSLFTHAETIAFRGILTPDQVEQVLRAIWVQKGTMALLDPELASRLHITRAQRSEVVGLLEVKSSVNEEISANSRTSTVLYLKHPELREQLDQVGANQRQRLEVVDGQIWDLLSPSQLRQLKRLIGVEPRSEQGRLRANSKKRVGSN